MVLLLKLVHGNSTSVKQMIAEFKTYWCEYVQLNNLAEVVRATISKTQLIKKIQTIATKGNNTQLGKLCYTVNSDILEKYGVADLELGSGLVYPVPKQQDSIVSSNIDNSITSTSHEGNMDDSSPVNGSKKETLSSGGITLEEHVSTNEPLSNATPAVEEPMELEWWVFILFIGTVDGMSFLIHFSAFGNLYDCIEKKLWVEETNYSESCKLLILLGSLT